MEAPLHPRSRVSQCSRAHGPPVRPQSHHPLHSPHCTCDSDLLQLHSARSGKGSRGNLRDRTQLADSKLQAMPPPPFTRDGCGLETLLEEMNHRLEWHHRHGSQVEGAEGEDPHLLASRSTNSSRKAESMSRFWSSRGSSEKPGRRSAQLRVTSMELVSSR
ncbi:hypothetical protein JZ751_023796 [Albula glossodonta]|uniref:Uncharacterized protein n=1 Tax=Albula glossodonta TaxID=121402 RepID=A0A8T2NP70_9TELE|nr:hypothetical protein JZ751_023796 [Albula glossodonta]